MTENGPAPDPEERRRKLVGRLAVIALLLLVAVYLVPLFLNLLS
ncbi:hypothetical protein [Phenylobacterium sp.]|nr:hypothetical protein [Phenylobacterium sp.]